jgi:hypothetical protein
MLYFNDVVNKNVKIMTYPPKFGGSCDKDISLRPRTVKFLNSTNPEGSLKTSFA